MSRVSECITQFEPRVELLDVKPGDARSSMRVSLVLVCRLRDSQHAFDLVFDTQRVALATLVLWRTRHNEFISPFGNFIF